MYKSRTVSVNQYESIENIIGSLIDISKIDPHAVFSVEGLDDPKIFVFYQEEFTEEEYRRYKERKEEDDRKLKEERVKHKAIREAKEAALYLKLKAKFEKV